MAIPDPKLNPDESAVREKAVRLIVGRVALVLLLLLANFWRTGGFPDLTTHENPDGLLLLFAITFALSIVYIAALRWGAAPLWQVRVQFAVDIVSITWLVVNTGDIISPYVTLYVVLISVAGFFLGKTETLVLAINCAIAFTTLSVLSANDLVNSAAGDQPAARVVQIVGVNDVAILLVGLLAARLSERRRLSEELKHSEESFADLHVLHERIVESVGSGLVTTDMSGRIYTFNRAAEVITGLRAADAIGKRVTELFGSGVQSKVEQCLEGVRTGARWETQFDAGFQNGSGPPRVQAACTVVPLLGKSGSTTGLIVMLHDVTQMRALEETVRRSDRLAAVGRMAAGLAHEIRNPLGSMSSALQFLQERSARPADEANLMDVVLRESDRMNNIITNFLAFARPAALGNERKNELIDVQAALNDCLSLIRHSPDVTDGHRFKIGADQDLFIKGDETQLKQVCWNLARNAIQAMPDGGVLSVRAFSEGDEIVVIFQDTGVGMDRDMLERLFEPFVSGSGGAGLGLSIVHRIVQEHGGRISVESEPGFGTKIRVEFLQARV
jgi:two-component system, NtrC family, sensor histidine kinase PilS